MANDLHRTARTIFNDVFDLDPDERDRLVNVSCADSPALLAEVQSLLAAHDRAVEREFLADGSSDDPEQTRGFRDEPIRFVDPLIGQTIGQYTVLELIGSGGMGAVYLVEQQSPRQKVALKIIRPGAMTAKTLRRFEDEAEFLGRLRHPNIARVFQAGASDAPGGRMPFFAMEFVDGQSITDHARNAGLSVRQRLELIATVCDAVQYAHQQGVIHRDLKPDNILVDQFGNPKIVDFGVARSTNRELAGSLVTEPGQIIGTPEYMAPEQCSGDPAAVDTRTDIYAIAVICYELLSGSRPFDFGESSIHSVILALQNDDPANLSSISREFRGDIETIVQRGMAKEPDQRYASAAAMAEDIRRHLSDEPILASRTSAMYHARKFVKRHRQFVFVVGFVAVAFMVTVAVVVGIVVRETQVKNQQRENNAIRSDMRKSLETVIGGLDRQSLKTALNTAIKNMEERSINTADVEQLNFETFGYAYIKFAGDKKFNDDTKFDDYKIAEKLLGQSLAHCRELYGDESEVTLRAVDMYADALRGLKRYDQEHLLLTTAIGGSGIVPGSEHKTASTREEFTLAVRVLRLRTKLAEVIAYKGDLGDGLRQLQDVRADYLATLKAYFSSHPDELKPEELADLTQLDEIVEIDLSIGQMQAQQNRNE